MSVIQLKLNHSSHNRPRSTLCMCTRSKRGGHFFAAWNITWTSSIDF